MALGSPSEAVVYTSYLNLARSPIHYTNLIIVMLTHRGFSAWIVVDGNPLPEYMITVDEDAHKVSCWIPSEEGKAFSVYWQDHGGNVQTCGYISLDGYVAPGRFLFGNGVAWRGGVRTGPTTERPFVFQKVAQKAKGGSSSIDRDIGTVTLQIKRVHLTSSRNANPIQQLPGPHKGREGMRIGFGEEQSLFDQSPATWNVEPYDNPGQNRPNTYVSFIFHYRDPAFLHAQGIIQQPRVSTQGRDPAPRIVSMPTNVGPVSESTLSPPLSLIDPGYYQMGSQPPEANPEFKRSISTQGYPGEGVIIFPVNRSTSNSSQMSQQTYYNFKPSSGPT